MRFRPSDSARSVLERARRQTWPPRRARRTEMNSVSEWRRVGGFGGGVGANARAVLSRGIGTRARAGHALWLAAQKRRARPALISNPHSSSSRDATISTRTITCQKFISQLSRRLLPPPRPLFLDRVTGASRIDAGTVSVDGNYAYYLERRRNRTPRAAKGRSARCSTARTGVAASRAKGAHAQVQARMTAPKFEAQPRTRRAPTRHLVLQPHRQKI